MTILIRLKKVTNLYNNSIKADILLQFYFRNGQTIIFHLAFCQLFFLLWHLPNSHLLNKKKKIKKRRKKRKEKKDQELSFHK